jgi:hypothetical protein
VWPDIVVIVSPQRQHSTGVGESVEYLFVEAFILQTAVEPFNVSVLLRLAWIDIMPLDLIVACPLQNALLVNSVPLLLTMQAGFA